MAKDPAVLFYVQDFLVGSSLLTPLQKGHYITLLCYQQQSETGSLTLEKIKSLMKSDFNKQWPVIQAKFSEDENGFFNERMRKEIAKRNKLSTRQAEIVKVRWDKYRNTVGNTTVIPRHENGIEVVLPARVSLSKEELNTKERERAGNTVGNTMVSYDAEKTISENQIEFERICMAAGKKSKEAKASLRKYHLHLTEKEQYPKSRKAVFAGFEKWLMNERIPVEDKVEKKDSLGGNIRTLTD